VGRARFVTLANDSWFGDSQEPWLHLALAKFRAVEHLRLDGTTVYTRWGDWPGWMAAAIDLVTFLPSRRR
jgi:apolipoprotein N-acyltransferase